MQYKIQEIMGLVEYYNGATKWGTTEQQIAARDAIESKLRELVREPLSDEAAQKLWAETTNIDCQSGGVALVRKVERAHNITHTSGVE